MPEGPEVAYYRDWLLYNYKNYYINNINIQCGRYKRHGDPKGYSEFSKELPLKIIDIKVDGKFLWFVMDKNWKILITFGLTGAFSKNTEHCRMIFDMIQSLSDKKVEELYYNDLRNFGTMQFVHGDGELHKKLKRLGYDPLVHKITSEEWNKLLEKKNKKAVAIWLLEQDLISGIGNYLRAEILYNAKIRPDRLVNTLQPDEKKRLLNEINKIPLLYYNSFKFQNTTTSHPKDIGFKVYRQNKDPKGNPVERMELQGRGVYWVPAIQS